MPTIHPSRLPLFLSLVLILAMAPVSSAEERVAFPVPPGAGPVTTILQEDVDIPQTRSARPQLSESAMQSLAQKVRSEGAITTGVPDNLGGDDVLVDTDSLAYLVSVDIATNGDIYAVVQVQGTRWPYALNFYRSLDGGDTWDPWGDLTDVTFGYRYPTIHVAEGTINKCFVTFTQEDLDNWDIGVASCTLSAATGNFRPYTVAMTSPSVHYFTSDLISDASDFSSYYLYLVAVGQALNGRDIWFARSTDQGATFETPYTIGVVTDPDYEYANPDIAYGSNGYLHVAWNLESRSGAFDPGLRYRRATNWANGGISAWVDPILALTSTANNIDETHPQIDASKSDSQVLIAYRRFTPAPWSLSTAIFGSGDRGVSFPDSMTISDSPTRPEYLERQPSTGDWIIGGIYGFTEVTIVRSNGSDFMTWSPPEIMDDSSSTLPAFYQDFAMDPSRNDAIAGFWSAADPGPGTDYIRFDAEWRAGPGYPNLADGFPVSLAARPISAPAVVDLDGDGDLEIVFGDENSQIQAFHHDGTAVANWPVTVPVAPSDGPVVVADLQANGDLLIIAGTVIGSVYAYHTDGTLAAGWPFSTGEGVSAYVSAGAFGGDYPRLVAIAAGERLRWVNYQAVEYPGGNAYFPGKTLSTPVAIGDVDGDGTSEAVGAASSFVFAIHPLPMTSVFTRTLPSDVSGAISLGDFDLDGDVEAAVPTSGGALYLLADDGTDFPGSWPFVSDTLAPLSSPAIAQCVGAGEPEIAVANEKFLVHLVHDDASQQFGYPVNSANWRIYGSPVMGYLPDANSADVVIGARGTRGWAWDNFGQGIPGWPKYFDMEIYLAPAMADIDLDGTTEIVFLARESLGSNGQLIVLDVNQVPAPPDESWPMAGYDPQRTGCANCQENFTVDVAGGSSAPTALRFSRPAPNPTAGRTLLSYALPERAPVDLGIYDIRGRLVASLVDSEVGPGDHSVWWDGRESAGRKAASGIYFARLEISGGSAGETRVRKIALFR